ncbi:YjgB family protein [Paenibacillus dakarensis]|uniref:YjgB family protein n=1 Tax=Paenibacillus dakarensis TaxID=1527293 RepID=UPI0006D58B4C|nr:YjgB family protein [Paenibacillus dakarensis]
MKKIINSKKILLATAMAAVVGLGSIGAEQAILPGHQVNAAPASVSDKDVPTPLKALRSFYKPALKGQFPGAVSGLTVGKSTRQDVIQKLGKPSQPRKTTSSFDVYGAHMGNPGYAISYNKSNKIQEMRYYGTNVERHTNIGGITMRLVKQNWYAPNSVSNFKNGKKTQTKLTYNRGEYKIEFIFNSSTDLDHINLLKR